MSNQSDKLLAYILCGGNGERLWPLSNTEKPKQFHHLGSQQSLFEDTLDRVALLEPDHLRIVASEHHRKTVTDLAKGHRLAATDFLFEPAARNTAAAIALATRDALHVSDNPLVLIAPSDHAITSTRAFRDCVLDALENQAVKSLTLIGIRPSRPDTGYGYIEATGSAPDKRKVTAFHEKPTKDLAECYFQSGKHFWNSGIFLFRAETMAKHFQNLLPELWKGIEKAVDWDPENQTSARFHQRLYGALPALSFDTAIVENIHDVDMSVATFDWSDLGSWATLSEAVIDGSDDNFVSGGIARDCSNTLISSSGIKIAAYGLDNIAIVATPDTVYMAPLSESHLLGELREEAAKFELPTGLTVEQKLINWFYDDALPFWAKNGVDWVNGGFHECLGFDAKPVEAPKRLRTMARQTWTFAEAANRTKNPRFASIAAHGLQFIDNVARSEMGFASVFSPEGPISDRTCRLYDCAMVLLAASAAETLKLKLARRLANELIVLLEAHFKIPKDLGFYAATGVGAKIASTNAHMHLLDALLNWNRATQCERSKNLADTIIEQFRKQIFNADYMIAREDLSVGAGDGRSQFWSPGHHYEWIHLLFSHPGRDETDLRIARQLWANARSFGTNPKTGLAHLQVSQHGRTMNSGSRSWAQCEAIRAVLALSQMNGGIGKDDGEIAVKLLLERHLSPAPRGGWIDALDENGTALSSDMPASIFYHVARCIFALQDHRSSDASS